MFSYDLFKIITFHPDYRWSVFWTLPVEISYYFCIPFYCILIVSCGKFWYVFNSACTIWATYIGLFGPKRGGISTLENNFGTFLLGIIDFENNATYKSSIIGSVFAINFIHFKHYLNCSPNSIFLKLWMIRLMKCCTSVILLLFLSTKTNRLIFWITPFKLVEGEGMRFISLHIASMIFLEINFPSWISELFELSILKFYGKISFPYYLTHFIFIPSTTFFTSLSSNYWDRMFFVFIGCFIIGALVHYAFERPIILLTDRISKWSKRKEVGLTAAPESAEVEIEIPLLVLPR